MPEGKGEISRVIYESLALKYRWAIERLEEDMLKKPIEALHIVGGGSKNALLNRFTAEAIKRPVIAGPDEGTIIGNLLVQAQALGAISGIRELREVVENSFPTQDLPAGDGRQGLGRGLPALPQGLRRLTRGGKFALDSGAVSCYHTFDIRGACFGAG